MKGIQKAAPEELAAPELLLEELPEEEPLDEDAPEEELEEDEPPEDEVLEAPDDEEPLDDEELLEETAKLLVEPPQPACSSSTAQPSHAAGRFEDRMGLCMAERSGG